MKKYFKYILIVNSLIILLGFASQEVNAVDYGRCVVRDFDTEGNSEIIGDQPSITYDACKTYEDLEKGIVINWTRNASQL
jgi:hypothetical protein